MNTPIPISTARWIRGISLLVIAVGLAFGWWLVVQPALESYRIRHVYREATCTILEAGVQESRGRTVRKAFFSSFRTRGSAAPIFVFRFQVGDQTVTAAGYDVYDGRGAKSADYSRFRVGQSYPCWYDPEDPERAVLVRDAQDNYWVAVLPLGLLAMGGIGFLIVRGPKPTVSGRKDVMVPPRHPLTRSEPIRLRWKPILIGGAVLLFIVLAVVLPLIAKQSRRDVVADVGGAKHDGNALLEALQPTGWGQETGFRSMEQGPRVPSVQNAGTAWIDWTRSFEATKDFTAVSQWHTEKLTARGWSLSSDSNATKTLFTRGEWRAELERLEDVTEGCRYQFRLHWKTQPNP